MMEYKATASDIRYLVVMSRLDHDKGLDDGGFYKVRIKDSEIVGLANKDWILLSENGSYALIRSILGTISLML